MDPKCPTTEPLKLGSRWTMIALLACQCGNVDVIKAFDGHVDWDSVKRSNPVIDLMKNIDSSKDDPRQTVNWDEEDKAIAALFEQAIAAGRFDVVLENDNLDVAVMVRLNMNHSVLKMLQAGMGVSESIDESGQTLLSIADETNPALANTMRSFSARSLAMSLINEIESEDSAMKTITHS